MITFKQFIVESSIPAELFHGTARPGASFKAEHTRAGIYFSSKLKDAEEYARSDAEFYDPAEPKVIVAELSLKNPKRVHGIESQELSREQIQKFKDEGYDGLVSGVEYVVFDPAQVKVLRVQEV